MMYKTLQEYVAEGNYSNFIKFAHSNNALCATDEDQENFYIEAPEQWALTLMDNLPPSPSTEKVIVRYQTQEVVSLLEIKWKLYPRTILWAFTEGTAEDAEKVLNALRDKPSSEAEVAMLKRGELELFKLWLEKFGELEDEAEKLINEDSQLSSLRSYYIDYCISK